MNTNSEAKLLAWIENIKRQDHSEKAVQAMKAGTGLVLNRLKKNFGATVNDACKTEVNHFKETVSTQIQSFCNAWIENQSNQLIVFPEGTRFVNREGNLLNVVIEQKPSVRVINYLDTTYSLSLPYVQFYITFAVENRESLRISQIKISCSKKPISSLNDRVFRMPLPNIGNTLCLGDMQNHGSSSFRNTSNVTDKCNETINLFWQSQFNNDLSDFFKSWLHLNFKNEFTNSGDIGSSRNVRLCLRSWQEKSKTNPLFVLDENCVFESFSSVSSFISSDFSSRNTKTALLNNIATVVNAETDRYIGKVLGSLNSVDIEEENRKTAHQTVLNEQITGMVNNTYVELWRVVHREHEEKVNEDHRVIQNKQNELQNRERQCERASNSLNLEKESFQSQKLNVQLEMYNIYNHLQEQLAEVEKLKAKLKQHFDEQGNVLPKARRGRPKKDALPPRVVQSMDIVSESCIPVGPNGETLKRRRGRPKKGSAA